MNPSPGGSCFGFFRRQTPRRATQSQAWFGPPAGAEGDLRSSRSVAGATCSCGGHSKLWEETSRRRKRAQLKVGCCGGVESLRDNPAAAIVYGKTVLLSGPKVAVADYIIFGTTDYTTEYTTDYITDYTTDYTTETLQILKGLKGLKGLTGLLKPLRPSRPLGPLQF